MSNDFSADADAPMLSADPVDLLNLIRDVLDPVTGRIRLLPAAVWQSLDPQLLQVWAYHATRWSIVTVELVDWLRDRIGGRRAIEIGAGSGDLGYYLGIPQTDSYAHLEDPAFFARAEELQIRLTTPPPDVRKLDGLKAVYAFRPDVVIASWVTQYGIEGEIDTYHRGVRETEILACADYILIGNERVHRRKRILALKHEEYSPPWLVSRARYPELNRIWIWKRRKKRRA
jgi:hypothetical protein